MKKQYSAAIIGCGKLGLPCGEVIASKFANICGYDLQQFNSKKLPYCSDLKKAILNKDFIFIAVPTPHGKQYGGEVPSYKLPPKDFNYDYVKTVLKQLNKIVTKEQVVILISTVLPGTVRSQFERLLPNNELIYNPYLIAMGTVKYDMVTPECVIIGTKTGKKTGAVRRLISFYKQVIVNKPLYHCGTWEEAESIKIFYNTFISFKLSFVNMILDTAQAVGNMNVDVVTHAIKNATYRIISPAYLTAGMGDGGACHPRDNIALRYLAKKLNLGYDIFQSVVESRDRQANNFAKFITKTAKKYKLPIVMYGKTYKYQVPLTDGSYSLLVANQIKQKVHFLDPLVNETPNLKQPCVFVLCHPFDKKNPYCKFLEGSVIIDPWRTFKTTKKLTVIPYGNTRSN
jgi:UDPglucose 6-dehydrogenase